MTPFHPYNLNRPSLEQKLVACRPAPSLDHLRATGLSLLAFHLVSWFLSSAALQEVRLTCAVLAHAQDPSGGVRISHNFKLTHFSAGEAPRDMPQTPADVETFALRCLPWQLMGSGSSVVLRENPWVQQALQVATAESYSAIAFEAALYGLALELDSAFASLNVVHDVGLTSTGH